MKAFFKKVILLIAVGNKEYLSPEEAAMYCGVSISQFNDKKEKHGIRSVLFMGKVCYRKADLRVAIETVFQEQLVA